MTYEWLNKWLNKLWIISKSTSDKVAFGSKYSRIDQVKFVQDSL